MTKKYKIPTIEDLFDAGVHFGHQIRRWNPNMEPYIFTAKKNIHIINLEESQKCLEKACNFLYEKAKNNEQIVFVGTKRQAKEIIENEARRCGAKYVTERWLGGTITNFKIMKKNIDKLVDMLKKRDDGVYSKYTKKERLMIDREIEKLQRSVGGIVGLSSIPGALFVIDSKREKTAVKEANISDVQVVSLVDTNSDPTNIDYPIPSNDDAIKSIALMVKTIADAVENGYKDYDPKEAVKEKTPKTEEEQHAADEIAKALKVTSNDENLVLDDDLTDIKDLEKISDKADEPSPKEPESAEKPKKEPKPGKKTTVKVKKGD